MKLLHSVALAVIVGASPAGAFAQAAPSGKVATASAPAQLGAAAKMQGAVERVKSTSLLRSATAFRSALDRGGVYLFPSEVALRNLLGSQLSSLFTFIVASHRAVVSAGAAEVAKQERERIVAMGPEAGGRMAASLVGLLRNSNTCEAGVWLDGLRPLATMPVAATTEVIQDYLVEEIENFKAGRLPRWRCAQVTSSAQLRDRLIADLFLLYLDTKPDPFEVLELHTDLSTRISSQRTKVAIGFNVSFYVGKLFKKSA